MRIAESTSTPFEDSGRATPFHEHSTNGASMNDQNLSEKVVGLETTLMHLQHEFEQLNSVVLQQQRELDAMKLKMKGLSEKVVELELPAEQNDPTDEKPPHY